MAGKLAVVLYEDSADKGQINNYGLHRLVCQCVADRMQEPSPRKLAKDHFQAIPCNGIEKLQARLKDDGDMLGKGGRRIIAVPDGDKIREKLGLPSSACRSQVVQIVRRLVVSQTPLSVVLLERNLESVLAAYLDDRWPPESQRLRALHALSLGERDKSLHRAADGDRSQRDRILQRVPSMARLVGQLESLYRNRPT